MPLPQPMITPSTRPDLSSTNIANTSKLLPSIEVIYIFYEATFSLPLPQPMITPSTRPDLRSTNIANTSKLPPSKEDIPVMRPLFHCPSHNQRLLRLPGQISDPTSSQHSTGKYYQITLLKRGQFLIAKGGGLIRVGGGGNYSNTICMY